MRSCAPIRIVSIAVALACIGWSAIAVPAAAQGVYPAAYGQACGPAAASPGPYSYEQPCEYPMAGNFGQCGAPSECGPCWTFAAEAIALQRTATRNQVLFQSATSGATLLNAKDLNFPMAFGPKISGIRHGIFGSKFDVEVAYFQFDGFEVNRFLPGASLMAIDVNDAFLSNNSSARYASQLYCGEVNVRWQWFDWLTVLSGFRMAELNEQYNAAGTGVQTFAPISLDVKAFNHLYGYQLGAEGEIYNMGGPLQIRALCKGGIFGNFADQHITAANNGFFNQTLDATNNRASFLGEVGLVATYSITQHLAFRASYEAMWLTGVALAPEQIDTSNYRTNLAKVNLDGQIFYHGGGLGFEYRY